PRLVSIRAASWPQRTAKPTSASTGMPSAGHSALTCSRGRSPIARRSIGTSQARPSTANVPSSLSSSDRNLTRSVETDSAATAASAAIGVSGHDPRADDALVALEPYLELLEVRVRLAAVEHDAVDEAVLRRTIAVGIPRKVGRIGSALVDEPLRGLEV